MDYLYLITTLCLHIRVSTTVPHCYLPWVSKPVSFTVLVVTVITISLSVTSDYAGIHKSGSVKRIHDMIALLCVDGSAPEYTSGSNRMDAVEFNDNNGSHGHYCKTRRLNRVLRGFRLEQMTVERRLLRVLLTLCCA